MFFVNGLLRMLIVVSNCALGLIDMSGMSVRCKRCRNLLFPYPECPLLDRHGNELGKSSNQENCSDKQDEFLWFLDQEKSPSWILSSVEKSGWTKGKLTCPGCHSRIGSFDFVSGLQCSCHVHALPPLHLVKAKVDAFPT